MYNCSEKILAPVIKKMIKDNIEVKVCFVLTHVPNPRMNKRIEVFKKFADVEVICARRLSQNIWEPVHKDIRHIIFNIDLPSSKHIIKRIYLYNGFRRKVLAKMTESRPTIVYAEGLDSLMIAGSYKKKNSVKIIYEVADLRESFIEKPKELLQRIVTYIIKQKEKKLFLNVDYLVTTSPQFYNLHYRRLIPETQTLFIPNAPDKRVFQEYKKKKSGKFTVGFIGGIRYLDQMKMLVDVADELDIDILFAGAGGTDNEYNAILDYCKGRSNIKFTGRYDYNREIAKLYSIVDCVYAVYNADNANVRIALPNKLYEAILCELPIIVAKRTYLSELVEEWGVGVSVDHKNVQELVEQLKKLRDDKVYYETIVNKCKEMRESVDLNNAQKKLKNLLEK